MMFTNATCIVWEMTVQNHAPAYIRHELGAVYRENTDGQEVAQSGNGTSRTPANAVFLCIPEASLTYVPKPDDRIVSGTCTDEKPPQTALTVLSVKDFRHGSARMRHIEVTAK